MPFKPGQSGNPGGRSKALQRLEKKLHGLTGKALRKLDGLLDHQDGSVALGAIREVLSRTLPVPKQSLAQIAAAAAGGAAGGHAAALRAIAERRALVAVDVQHEEVTATPLDRVSDSE